MPEVLVINHVSLITWVSHKRINGKVQAEAQGEVRTSVAHLPQSRGRLQVLGPHSLPLGPAALQRIQHLMRPLDCWRQCTPREHLWLRTGSLQTSQPLHISLTAVHSARQPAWRFK
jgi:hypothetical protein